MIKLLRKKLLGCIMVGMLINFLYSEKFVVDEVSARGIVLGEGYAVAGGDSGVIFKNPAAVGFEGSGVSGLYGMPFMEMSELGVKYMSGGFVYNLGVSGAVGVGIWMFDAGGIYKESVYVAGYSKVVKVADKDLSIGGSIKFMNTQVGVNSNDYNDDPLLSKASKGVVDVDLGGILRVDEKVKVGLSVRNGLGNDAGVELEDKLDREISVGCGYFISKGSQDVEFLFGVLSKGQDIKISAGVEAYIAGKFGVRCGYTGNGYGFGVGLRLNKIYLDYGYLITSEFVEGGGSHYISLGMKF